MIDAARRTLLKGSLAAGSLGAAAAVGLIAPGTALADWNQAAFDAKDLDAARQDLLGTTAPETNDAIVIKVPDIAENGAVVPVTVETSLADIASISLFAAGNPTPLVASFVLGPAALPFVSTRIKMGKSAEVIAVVKQGAQLLRNAKNVKVTIGGCGG